MTEPRVREVPWPKLLFGQPVMASLIVIALLWATALFDGLVSTILGNHGAHVGSRGHRDHDSRPRHRAGSPGTACSKVAPGVFTVLVTIGILVGGVAEIIPMVVSVPETMRTTKNVPYKPLELEGRDVFISEGCYTCHSQMIRPFTWESARYGEVSSIDDSIFDHPFQWGSRRIGPDLARIGGKYADVWHYKHMLNPREISVGSNMPPYPHLATQTIDFSKTPSKLRAMRNVGVPYEAYDIQTAEQNAQAAATAIAAGLAEEAGVQVCEELTDGCELVVNSQLVALISYLQRLGQGTGRGKPGDVGRRTPIRSPRRPASEAGTMSRFAAEFFADSPALLYPILALVLFFTVFLVVIIRVRANEALGSGAQRANSSRRGAGGTP